MLKPVKNAALLILAMIAITSCSKETLTPIFNDIVYSSVSFQGNTAAFCTHASGGALTLNAVAKVDSTIGMYDFAIDNSLIKPRCDPKSKKCSTPCSWYEPKVAKVDSANPNYPYLDDIGIWNPQTCQLELKQSIAGSGAGFRAQILLTHRKDIDPPTIYIDCP